MLTQEEQNTKKGKRGCLLPNKRTANHKKKRKVPPVHPKRKRNFKFAHGKGVKKKTRGGREGETQNIAQGGGPMNV